MVLYTAIGALIVSFIGTGISVWKLAFEIKDRKNKDIKEASERSLTAVQAAENALLIMQQVLDLTKAESIKKDMRIEQLEARVFELENKLAQYEGR